MKDNPKLLKLIVIPINSYTVNGRKYSTTPFYYHPLATYSVLPVDLCTTTVIFFEYFIIFHFW